MPALDTFGAGLDMLPRLDLNAERREERARVGRRNSRRVAGIAALVALGPALLAPPTRLALQMRAQRARYEVQTADVDGRLKTVTAISGRADARAELWTRFSQSRAGRSAWEDMLPTLAAALPADTAIEQVQVSRSGDGVKITAQGSSESMAGVRSFLASLGASPLFARVRLTETTADPGLGPQGVSFKIDGPVDDVPAGAGQ